MDSLSESTEAPPSDPYGDDYAGSSVSSLLDEYDELLRYATVTPQLSGIVPRDQPPKQQPQQHQHQRQQQQQQADRPTPAPRTRGQQQQQQQLQQSQQSQQQQPPQQQQAWNSQHEMRSTHPQARVERGPQAQQAVHDESTSTDFTGGISTGVSATTASVPTTDESARVTEDQPSIAVEQPVRRETTYHDEYVRVQRSPSPSRRAARAASPTRVVRNDVTSRSHFHGNSTNTNVHNEIGDAVLDEDLVRLDSEMDNWNAMLKKAVLAEFSHTKVQMMQRSKLQLEEERRKYAEHISRLQTEIEELKELLQHHESIIRKKDQIIANFAAKAKREKEKHEMAKSLHVWKLAHVDAQRETFAFKMAKRYHRHVLLAKAWRAWRASIQSKWRDRVEKACQAKAQQVCRAVSTDYESKLGRVQEELRKSRHEVQSLQSKQSRYEEDMKKAFMRGVCALNLEAMSMFRSEEGGTVSAQSHVQAQAAQAAGPHVSFPPADLPTGTVQAPARGPSHAHQAAAAAAASAANTSVEAAFNADGSLVHGAGRASTAVGPGTVGAAGEAEATPRAGGAPVRSAPSSRASGTAAKGNVAMKAGRPATGKTAAGSRPLVQRHDPALTRINGARPNRISQIVD